LSEYLAKFRIYWREWDCRLIEITVIVEDTVELLFRFAR